MLQLASTEEYIDGQFTGNLGEVLIRYPHSKESLLQGCSDLCPFHESISVVIGVPVTCRCNNVLYMRGVPEEDEPMT